MHIMMDELCDVKAMRAHSQITKPIHCHNMVIFFAVNKGSRKDEGEG